MPSTTQPPSTRPQHRTHRITNPHHQPTSSPKEISTIEHHDEETPTVCSMALHYHHALYHDLEHDFSFARGLPSSSSSPGAGTDAGAGARSPPDLLWLSNPGIGHPHLAQLWAPSLERALQTGVPLALTSHSAVDAARDVEALGSCQLGVEWLHPPQPNPFRSLKLTPDPFGQETDATRPQMVQANYGWMGLRGVV